MNREGLLAHHHRLIEDAIEHETRESPEAPPLTAATSPAEALTALRDGLLRRLRAELRRLAQAPRDWPSDPARAPLWRDSTLDAINCLVALAALWRGAPMYFWLRAGELAALARDLGKRGRELIEVKNRDYSDWSGEDPFGNFRLTQTLGICSVEAGLLARLSDKLSRLETFARSSKLAGQDEKIEDTILDAINYLAILSAWVASRAEGAAAVSGELGRETSGRLQGRPSVLRRADDEAFLGAPREGGYSREEVEKLQLGYQVSEARLPNGRPISLCWRPFKAPAPSGASASRAWLGRLSTKALTQMAHDQQARLDALDAGLAHLTAFCERQDKLARERCAALEKDTVAHVQFATDAKSEALGRSFADLIALTSRDAEATALMLRDLAARVEKLEGRAAETGGGQ